MGGVGVKNAEGKNGFFEGINQKAFDNSSLSGESA
jgi:hypothetical protein